MLIRRRFLAPYERTQSKMNRTYVIDADIWLAFRLQLTAKIILLSLMFSSAVPLLLLIVSMYCGAAHLVDKYLLFRVLRKPPHTQHLRLMYATVCWLLPLAVLARLGLAIFVFLGLRCGCDESRALASASDVLFLAVDFRNFQPVQTIVVVCSLLLSLPLLFMLGREVAIIWAARQRRHRVTPMAEHAPRRGGARPSPAVGRSRALTHVAVEGAARMSRVVTTVLKPTSEGGGGTVPTRPAPMMRATTAYIRTHRGRSRSRGRADDTGTALRSVSFGAIGRTSAATVSFRLAGDDDASSSQRISGRCRNSSTFTRGRSESSRGRADSNASTFTANARAASMAMAGSYGRSRASSASGAGRYQLPDVAQMYLPPLTMCVQACPSAQPTAISPLWIGEGGEGSCQRCIVLIIFHDAYLPWLQAHHAEACGAQSCAHTASKEGGAKEAVHHPRPLRWQAIRPRCRRTWSARFGARHMQLRWQCSQGRAPAHSQRHHDEWASLRHSSCPGQRRTCSITPVTAIGLARRVPVEVQSVTKVRVHRSAGEASCEG